MSPLSATITKFLINVYIVRLLLHTRVAEQEKIQKKSENICRNMLTIKIKNSDEGVVDFTAGFGNQPARSYHNSRGLFLLEVKR